MAMAIKMENAATMLRIAAERLATETKNVYGDGSNEESRNQPCNQFK